MPDGQPADLVQQRPSALFTPDIRVVAVLHQDGMIEMSYGQLTARDAIIGVYPMLSTGEEKALGTVAGEENSGVPAHLDLTNVKLGVVNGLFLQVSLEIRGPVLNEGDSALSGVGYRVYFYAHKPTTPGAEADATWTIRGFAPQGRHGKAATVAEQERDTSLSGREFHAP